MIFTGITPVHKFDRIYVKREDLACWTSLDYPSGSKVRQYFEMAQRLAHPLHGGHLPCLVGCSANSAMAIYVAATAKQLNTKGIIYTAQRKVKPEGIKYAERLGAEIHFVKPGYLSVIRKEARQRAIDLKQIVQWDRTKAIEDTINQCINIPSNIKRIIVPTGSGLTAAGVLIGTAHLEKVRVLAVCTSLMADKAKIMRLVHATRKEFNPGNRLTVIGPMTPYDIPQVQRLPDGTPLDPFYSAKAWGYVQTDDLFWPPGLRPVTAMPEICQKNFSDWKGPDNAHPVTK